MKPPIVAIVLLLLAASVSAQTNLYSQWPNFPQSPNFFPIANWLQNPNACLDGGSYPGCLTVAAQMKNTKMNVALAIDGGSGGGGWPSGFGVDCGAGTCNQFQTLVNNGIYVIPDVNSSNNTASDSVASMQKIASTENATQYLIGYNLGDEPQCGTQITGLPTNVSTVSGFDNTRPLFYNLTDWVFNHGVCNPSSQNSTALKAISVGSFDLYPIISPWNGLSGTGTPQDAMWIQGWSVEQFIANGRAGQPMWAYVDTGTDALSYSSQNGSNCNFGTNICTNSGQDPNEARATAEQVNAEVWMQLINGAMGIEYFCQDSQGYSFCLGGSAQGSISQAMASNITYINTTVLSFAPQLNSSVSGICTMNTGTSYSNHVSSCTNGILTMSTNTSSVPGSAIVKNYNGTLYLFADSDRNGSATMTFTLNGYAGQTATIVYDSNAHYDSAHSSLNQTFTLNASGQFSDTFGANGHNYQPKIYKITSGAAGPTAPTNLSAIVQ